MDEKLLGKKVRDMITGFEGTCTAECYYLDDTTKCLVTSKTLVDGEVKSEWFAKQRLQTITAD